MNVHRYRYDGVQPVIFHELTAFGVGVVEPGDVVELPVEFEHELLHPLRAANGQNGRTKGRRGSKSDTAPETSEADSTDAEPTGDDSVKE